MPTPGANTFLLTLLKPSHYGDDGYVIQWWRGSVPSNSLSNLYALAQDAQRRAVLGQDVEIELDVRDKRAGATGGRARPAAAQLKPKEGRKRVTKCLPPAYVSTLTRSTAPDTAGLRTHTWPSAAPPPRAIAYAPDRAPGRTTQPRRRRLARR